MKGVLLAALAVMLAACHTAPPVAEPFLRDRTGTVARAYESAVHALGSAREAQASALAGLTDAVLEGITPSTAYDHARRLLLRVQGRIDAADRAIAYAHDRGQDLHGQWEGELRRYSDEALREDARRRLDEADQARQRLDEALGRANAALAPAAVEITDRTLFLKHCRDQGVMRPAPVSQESLNKYAARREDVAVTLAEANVRLDDYLRLLGKGRANPGLGAGLTP